MLRVTIDVVPHGAESAKRTIHQFVIENVNSHGENREYGDYAVHDELGSKKLSAPNYGLGPVIGRIFNFPRKRPSYAESWLRVVAEALNLAIIREERPYGEEDDVIGEHVREARDRVSDDPSDLSEPTLLIHKIGEEDAS